MRIYSIVIPVYNRPDELEDLLDSLCRQTYIHFEVLVVEDGSTQPSDKVVKRFCNKLDIHYYKIKNRGPGGARNYGAAYAKGEYLLILDSDVVVPAAWLEQIHDALKHYPVEAFGGPDRAHVSFSPIQKAVSYAMTSFFTTGGIRGGRRTLDKFYPRSFNMGVKREVYQELGGFSNMRYGEDVDFSIRIMKAGYRTRLFPAAWVYHKRRTSFKQFFHQVMHSGEARIDLCRKYPDSLKAVHCFPLLFMCGVCLLFLLSMFDPVAFIPVLAYCLLLLVDATKRAKGNLQIGMLSAFASFVQLFGYGWGFFCTSVKVLFMAHDDNI